jgi:hypothetical protein
LKQVNAEYKAAEAANLNQILADLTATPKKEATEEAVKEPAKKPFPKLS